MAAEENYEFVSPGRNLDLLGFQQPLCSPVWGFWGSAIDAAIVPAEFVLSVRNPGYPNRVFQNCLPPLSGTEVVSQS
jgi:hypothetical protein